MSWKVTATITGAGWGWAFSATWTDPEYGTFTFKSEEGTVTESYFVRRAIYERDLWRRKMKKKVLVENDLLTALEAQGTY